MPPKHLTRHAFPDEHFMRPALAAAFLLALLACTSPTAPPPTGPNATISGTVVERVDGAPYSFLRLETESGLMWVAVPMADVPRKSKVTGRAPSQSSVH
jgi:hypothetical protein